MNLHRIVALSIALAASAAHAQSGAFKECPDCPMMMPIPAGSFVMGATLADPAKADIWSEPSLPPRGVTIAPGLALGVYPVTFAEWDACRDDGGCKDYFPYDESWGRDRRPVINVDMDNVQAYLRWLNGRTGKHYRLPSEAEWEYAARAGTTTGFWWGEAIGSGNANCIGCGSEWDGKRTAPVGQFRPNPFGLYDMAGNVYQWTEDCWHENYVGAPTDGSAWLAEGCKFRVVRGGSWNGALSNLRVSFRARRGIGNQVPHLGFRVARTE